MARLTWVWHLAILIYSQSLNRELSRRLPCRLKWETTGTLLQKNKRMAFVQHAFSMGCSNLAHAVGAILLCWYKTKPMGQTKLNEVSPLYPDKVSDLLDNPGAVSGKELARNVLLWEPSDGKQTAERSQKSYTCLQFLSPLHTLVEHRVFNYGSSTNTCNPIWFVLFV